METPLSQSNSRWGHLALRLVKILGITFASVVLTIGLILGTGLGQKWLLDFVSHELSHRLEIKVRAQGLSIGMHKIALDEVLLSGCQNDTLALLHRVELRWQTLNPWNQQYRLGSIDIDRIRVWVRPSNTVDSSSLGTNWDCIFNNVQGSKKKLGVNLSLSLNRFRARDIIWVVSGYPQADPWKPTKTSSVTFNKVQFKENRWHFDFSFKQFLAHSNSPYLAKGHITGFSNGTIRASQSLIKHPEAEIDIPLLTKNPLQPLTLSNAKIQIAEGHLNRWIPAPTPWPTVTIHCPITKWDKGRVSWNNLTAHIASSLTAWSTGYCNLNASNATTRFHKTRIDSSLFLSYKVVARPQWEGALTTILSNTEFYNQDTKDKITPKIIQAYLPDPQNWVILGQLTNGNWGLNADGEISSGISRLKFEANSDSTLKNWLGNVSLNGYTLSSSIRPLNALPQSGSPTFKGSVGSAVVKWSASNGDRIKAQMHLDSIQWENEILRDFHGSIEWKSNAFTGQIHVRDSMHRLLSEWSGRLRNGTIEQLIGQGSIDLQIPKNPEFKGPLRVLGNFVYQDTGNMIQAKLSNGLLLANDHQLNLEHAELTIQNGPNIPVIRLTINRDSVHCSGILSKNQFARVYDQVFSYIFENSPSPEPEIPFRTYVNVQNLNDYLPFFSRPPVSRCEQFVGTIQWSRNQYAFDSSWNRVIRANLGMPVWKNWAAQSAVLVSESFGPSLLANLDVNRLTHDGTDLFRHVHYQQVRANQSSSIRLECKDSAETNSALFVGSLNTADGQWALGIDSLKLQVKNQEWSSNTGAKVRKYGDVWDLDSIQLTHGASMLLINGLLSNNQGNRVTLDIQNLGLQQLMAISGQKNRLVDGTINGKITGDGLLSQLNLTGELRVPQIQLQGVNLGELSIQSTYVPQNNRLVLQANIDNGETFPAKVNGWISMNDPSLSCDLIAKLDNAPLQLLELVLKPALDSIRGMADAEIRLTGSIKEPQIQGSILLNDARFRIPYLKNSYKITGNVQVEPGHFLFPNSYVQDMDRGQAKISGQVKHRNFREWTYKFEMDSARNILVLNEPRLVEGDYYFGLGRINGNGWIAGDEKSTQIQVRAETVKGSRLTIPLDDLKEDRTYNFIRFKSKGEAISKNKETSIEQSVSLRGIEFNMELTLNPACAVTLLLDRRYGDQIKGTGNGNLNLSLTREGDLSLTGNYIFEQGKYTFNFVNLVNKNFDIKSGGRIDWNGDPYAGIMQIDAVYMQPTSVRSLIGANPAGQTDSRSILNVETFLNLSGPILQPAVKFRINLPTITDNNPNDVLVQQINRINNNEQELNNQVLGLLVSGQFIPSENLNAANLGLSTGATAFNSVTEMLTTRLSNLLNNSLGGGINLGINYRGDLGTGILNSNNSNNALADSNRRDLNLALNTTLFNNRLVIDGNLGMGNSFQVNSRNMAAGINLEYLINKSGTIRAKAFNRPDDRILFNQSQNLNYRQGVGLSYNRNFNRWSELLRKNPRQ